MYVAQDRILVGLPDTAPGVTARELQDRLAATQIRPPSLDTVRRQLGELARHGFVHREGSHYWRRTDSVLDAPFFVTALELVA